MAYHVIQQSTTTDANDVRENFEHIGSGSRLPMSIGSGGAGYTDSTYDLGSSAYKWNNLYCNEIILNGETFTSWNRISTTEITSGTVARIEITGLNGDTDIEYEIIARIISGDATSQSYYLHCNGDSASNYAYEEINGNAAVVSASINSATGYYLSIVNQQTTTTKIIFGNGKLYAKTGYERTFISDFLGKASEKYCPFIINTGQIWNNTSSTITSLVFTGPTTTSFATGTFIDIYARR